MKSLNLNKNARSNSEKLKEKVCYSEMTQIKN